MGLIKLTFYVSQEWHHQLRSSLHPLLFAAIYKAADLLASSLHLSSATRAELLLAGPKTAQAVIAALGDFYTWKLATRIYGNDSRGAWTTVGHQPSCLNNFCGGIQANCCSCWSRS